MEIFLLTFLLMVLAILGLATGVLLGRNPLQGSCGGLNNLPGISCDCQQPCETKKRLLETAEAVDK